MRLFCQIDIIWKMDTLNFLMSFEPSLNPKGLSYSKTFAI